MASKNYRKFMATGVTAAVVASAVAPVASAATFTDVPAGAWYKGAVDYVAGKGYMTGTSSTTFAPTKDITRAEAATLFANKLDLYKAGQVAGYSDVKSGAWYHNAVAAVKEGKIMGSTGGDMFSPDRLLTRGEVAALIVRAYGFEGTGKSTSFTDVSNSIFKNDIATLVELGIADGVTGTTFAPNKAVSRAEMAAFIQKADEAQNTTPTVKSVSAINATQVEVKFNQAVDKTDVETNANTLFTINNVGAQSAKLSADGKTATLTFALPSQVEVTDAVFVVNPVKTAANASVSTEKYTQVFTYEDTVRPVVTNTTYSNYQNAVIHFSEPMSSLGSVSVSNPNVVVGPLAADGLSVPVSLSAAAEGSYSVTFVGATDKSGNLIVSNPTTVSLVKSKTDSVKPTVTGVTTSGTSNLTVKFSEALSGLPTVTVSGTTVTSVTQDSTDPTKYNVVLGTPVTGVKTVSVAAGYVDPSGNAGAAYSTLAQFTADSTAPSYVSHQVKTISGTQYLVVSFNEALVSPVGTISGSYVDANTVTHSVANLGPVTLFDANNDGTNESIKVNLTGNAAGNYTVNLPAGIATDASTNASAAKSLTFGLGTLADSTKPVVSSIDTQTAKGDANTITVRYNVDVTAATALSLSNYTVEGQNVFTNAIFDGNQRTVTLTLREDAITLDGVRNLTVQNVKGVNGVVMNASTTQISFDENVKPTITSATLKAANTIEVDFSELMTVNSIAAAGAGDDFEVYINGVKATVASIAVGAADDKYTITLDPATVVGNLSDTVTLKVLTTNNVIDAGTPANALKTSGSITVSK
jgi:trimeric autotransporter adhesin